jgi:hypothetical protein
MHDPPDSLGFSVDKHRVPSQFRSPPSARGKGVHQVDSEEDEIVVVPHLNGIIELGLDLEDDGDDGDDDVEMLSDGAHDIPDERVMSLWVSSDEEEEEGEVDERDDSDDEKPIPIAPKTKVTIFAGPKAKSSASRFVAPAQFLRSILSPSPSGESTSHPESTPQATSSASPERNATFFRHGSAVATPLPRKLASAARANAAPYHKVKDEDIEELPSPIKGGRRRPPKSPSTAKSPVKPTKSPAKSPIKAKKPATPRASTSEPATLPGKRAKRSSVSASPTKTTKRIKKETIDELASLSTGTSASRHAHALAAGPMKLQASDGISRGNGKWPSFPEGWDKLTMITDEVVCDRVSVLFQ